MIFWGYEVIVVSLKRYSFIFFSLSALTFSLITYLCEKLPQHFLHTFLTLSSSFFLCLKLSCSIHLVSLVISPVPGCSYLFFLSTLLLSVDLCLNRLSFLHMGSLDGFVDDSCSFSRVHGVHCLALPDWDDIISSI